MAFANRSPIDRIASKSLIIEKGAADADIDEHDAEEQRRKIVTLRVTFFSSGQQQTSAASADTIICSFVIGNFE